MTFEILGLQNPGLFSNNHGNPFQFYKSQYSFCYEKGIIKQLQIINERLDKIEKNLK